MKKVLLLLTFIMLGHLGFSQISSEDLNSSKLGSSRKITTIAPEGYDKKQKYPLFVVLNAHLNLEPVVANVRYLTRIGHMPPSVIVGVYNEDDEVVVPQETGVPFNDSANFFEFIGQEVIPHIAKKYSLNDFKGIIANGEAGNFINFYLLKENSLFNAYISINPDLQERNIEPIVNQLGSFKKPIFYHLSWTENDDKKKVEIIQKLHKQIASKEKNDNLIYVNSSVQTAPEAVALSSIPEGLNLIFEEYRPITMREYAEEIIKINENVAEYITEKYKKIQTLYGIEKKPLMNDVKAIYHASIKNADFESLPILGEFVRKDYKDTALPDFIEGEYFARTELPKRAFKSYQRAFSLAEVDFITKEYLGQKIEEMQKAAPTKSKGKKKAKEEIQEEPVQEEVPSN